MNSKKPVKGRKTWYEKGKLRNGKIGKGVEQKGVKIMAEHTSNWRQHWRESI